MNRPMIANYKDPKFVKLAELLQIPPRTVHYRLEFTVNSVVTVETKFELSVQLEDVP